MKQKHCKWCDDTFETEISYQIYCSADCRDAATKEKILDRYQTIKRKKRIGKTRLCKSCGSSLSIYNDDLLCNNCNVNPVDIKKALKELKGFSNDKGK